MPNNDSLNPPEFTLSVWIKRTGFKDRVWRRIFDKGYGHGYDLTMGGDLPNGKSVFRGRAGLEVGRAMVDSGMEIADDKWHHLVGTYDGNNSRLYVDGIAKNKNP